MNSLLKIESLNINNFATIKNQHVDFTDGFNVIVGETGSGKSLIIDALQLTFGARAEKKLVRKGSSFSSVEVSFTVEKDGLKKIKAFCDELGFPFEDTIHIKRVIYKEGNSKAFLNHQSCPLSILASFTRRFIDLVGQFENQKLLSPDYQLRLLDSYARLGEKYKKYSTIFSSLKDFNTELESLESKFQNREREIDYLEFQLNEFNSLNPTPQDEKKLIEEKDRLLNAEKIDSAANEFRYIVFEESEGGLLSKFKTVSNKLLSTPLNEYELISEKIASIENAIIEIDDLISNNSNNISGDEQSLEDILESLDRYQKLKRKFNLQTEELQEKQESLEKDLKKLHSIESKIDEVLKKIRDTKTLCLNLAHELHKSRTTASKNLSKELTSSIQKLNMEGASIKFLCHENPEVGTNGITKLELSAETNPGEGFYNLSKIASGGELSRILLSLRHLMTSQDSISVFLFDEIDTGIGGKTAIKIGEMLREISGSSQVIAITHLPQIASFADNLVTVEKQTVNSRTESLIQNLVNKKKDKYVSEMNQLN